jgi:hypothetical protein
VDSSLLTCMRLCVSIFSDTGQCYNNSALADRNQKLTSGYYDSSLSQQGIGKPPGLVSVFCLSFRNRRIRINHIMSSTTLCRYSFRYS